MGGENKIKFIPFKNINMYNKGIIYDNNCNNSFGGNG